MHGCKWGVMEGRLRRQPELWHLVCCQGREEVRWMILAGPFQLGYLWFYAREVALRMENAHQKTRGEQASATLRGGFLDWDNRVREEGPSSPGVSEQLPLEVADSKEGEPKVLTAEQRVNCFSLLVVTPQLWKLGQSCTLRVLWGSESDELQRVMSLHRVIGPWGHLWAL